MLARPEKAQPPLPARSGLAATACDYGGLTYQWERLGAIVRELAPLVLRHAQEVEPDLPPADPEWDRYFDYDLAGALHILTVRRKALLVGYVPCFIWPSLHRTTLKLCAVDGFWLDPAFRTAWAGVKMFREMEKGVRARGAQRINLTEKLGFKNWQGRSVSVIFKRLGFEKIETVWAKDLK